MTPTSPVSEGAAAERAAPAKRGRPSRRPAIFASALRLFRQRGFHATSINDIGADAGVAGTAIYSHFNTKQALLTEAIHEGAKRIRDGVAEALSTEEPDPSAALERLVRAYVRVVLENADMNACYVLEARSLESEVRVPLARSERSLRELFSAHLLAERPELSPDQAHTMVQMAVFALVALCVHRTRMTGDDLVDLAVSQVIGALRAPVPPVNETNPSDSNANPNQGSES